MRYRRATCASERVHTNTATVYWAKGQEEENEEGEKERNREKKKKKERKRQAPKKKCQRERSSVRVYVCNTSERRFDRFIRWRGESRCYGWNVSTTRVTVVTPIGFWLYRSTLKIFLDYWYINSSLGDRRRYRRHRRRRRHRRALPLSHHAASLLLLSNCLLRAVTSTLLPSVCALALLEFEFLFYLVGQLCQQMERKIESSGRIGK